MAWPALDASTGEPVGANQHEFVDGRAARSVDVEASKAFVQWLWVDQTGLPTRVRHRLRVPHPGPQQPGG